MSAFLLRRLLLAVPTLAGVLVVVFLLLYVAPGDPVQEMVGERADAETIARLRRELRLDDPLHIQFAHYAGGVMKGDLGTSYITGRPILRDIAERFPKTLLLAASAMVLAAILGITIGVVSARFPGGWLDRVLARRRVSGNLVSRVLGGPPAHPAVRGDAAMVARRRATGVSSTSCCRRSR